MTSASEEENVCKDGEAEEANSEINSVLEIPAGCPVHIAWPAERVPLVVDFQQLVAASAAAAELPLQTESRLTPPPPPFGRDQRRPADRLDSVIQRIQMRVERMKVSAPTDQRKNEEFSDFLEEDVVSSASEQTDTRSLLDVADFRVLDAHPFFAQLPDEETKDLDAAADVPGDVEAEYMREFGDRPDWKALAARMEDPRRRQTIFEHVQQLEDALCIAGSTRHRKLQQLRAACQVVRRLVPKAPKYVQNFWRKALTVLVEEAPAPVEVRAEVLATAWEEAAVTTQREEICRLRQEVAGSLAPETMRQVVEAFAAREVFGSRKFEAQTAAVSKLFEIWRREEECHGRFFPPPVARRKPGQQEKRFVAHLLDLFFPEVGSEEKTLGGAMLLLTRTSLFGGKQLGSSTASRQTTADSGEDKNGGDEPLPSVTLPCKVFLVRRGNELLECRLTDFFAVDRQAATVTEKDWGTADRDFASLADVFNSYEQQFVKPQDRTTVTSPLDALRYFAVKLPDTSTQKHLFLYDAIVKTATVFDWLFIDSRCFPIFIPPASGLRIPRGKRKDANPQPPTSKPEAPEAETAGQGTATESKQRAKKKSGAKERPQKKAPFSDEFLEFPEQFQLEDFVEEISASMQIEL